MSGVKNHRRGITGICFFWFFSHFLFFLLFPGVGIFSRHKSNSLGVRHHQPRLLRGSTSFGMKIWTFRDMSWIATSTAPLDLTRQEDTTFGLVLLWDDAKSRDWVTRLGTKKSTVWGQILHIDFGISFYSGIPFLSFCRCTICVVYVLLLGFFFLFHFFFPNLFHFLFLF